MVEVLDGAGLRGTGPLAQTGKEWWVDIQNAVREPPPAELTLAVAAGDRDRFAWMVEKAVELGVTCILPLETARSSGVATKLKDAHLGTAPAAGSRSHQAMRGDVGCRRWKPRSRSRRFSNDPCPARDGWPMHRDRRPRRRWARAASPW